MMAPLGKVEMTLPRFSGVREMGHAGGVFLAAFLVQQDLPAGPL